MFKLWLLYTKVSKKKFKYLQINNKKKLINIVFKSFYKKKNIIINYKLLYMPPKNGIAK